MDKTFVTDVFQNIIQTPPAAVMVADVAVYRLGCKGLCFY